MMNLKTVQKTSFLFTSFIGLSLVLLGCGTNTVQSNVKSLPTASSSLSEPATSPQTTADTAVARGLSIYIAQCKGCHGTNGSGGKGPALISKTLSASFIQSNMPLNKPKSLSSDEVSDLVAYITSLK